MYQFVNEDGCISLLIHMSIQFYQKIPWFVVPSRNITISISTFTFHTTMKNLNFQFVSWKILRYKPAHHIFTEFL